MDIPPEIWVEIFMLSLPPLDLPQAPQKVALVRVCRLWNAMVESSPTLWSGISIRDKIGYVQKSLLKSGESPIDVYGACTFSTPHVGCYHVGACRQFMREVNRHTQRWRFVTLHVMSEGGYAPSCDLFPLLRSLRLNSTAGLPTGKEYLVLLNSSQTPYLHELFLDHPQPANWNISLSPNLSKLSIHYSLPSSSELLSILKDCPKLAILDLYLFTLNDEVISRADYASIVNLTALQRLELNNTSVGFAGNLLQGLRLPEDCDIALKLRVERVRVSTSFWNRPLSHYQDRFQSAGQINPMKITASAEKRGGALIGVRGYRWNVEL
ncbi:hypothetical protein FRC01_003681 [Tulasnella sp. 417]|nr:hypothetical protein FRC01_003681 [Tulasnella sp. 417]